MNNIKAKIKGLNSYTALDSKHFFGHDASIENALEILKNNKILTVNGVQSSGKSSFVESGLLNRIKNKFPGESGNDWKVCSFRPGRNPIDNLCTALSSDDLLYLKSKPNSSDYDDYIETINSRQGFGLIEIFKKSEIFGNKNLLIHIDQFEDIFKYPKFFDHSKQEDDELFIDIINKTVKNSSTSIYFVITIETKFLPRLNTYGTFSELLSLSLFNLPNINFDSFYDNVKGELNFTLSPKIINRCRFQISENPSLLASFQFLLSYLQKKSNDEKKIYDEGNFDDETDLNLIVGLKLDEYFTRLDENKKIIYQKFFRSLINCDFESNKVYYQKFSYIKKYTGLSSNDLTRFIKDINEKFDYLIDSIDQNITPITKKYNFEYKDDSIIVLRNAEIIRWPRFRRWEKEEEINYELINEALDCKKNKDKLDFEELNKFLKFLKNSYISKNWSEKYKLDYTAITDYIFEQKKRFDIEIEDKKNYDNKMRKNKKFQTILTYLIISAATLFTIYVIKDNLEIKSDRKKLKAEVDKNNGIEKKYDSILKVNKKLLINLKIDQDSLNLSRQIINDKQEKIIQKTQQILIDQITIDSQINQINANKKEINFINSEIELAKIFIEITKKEIELKNDIKSLTKETSLLRDDNLSKKLEFAKQSFGFYNDFLRIQKTKDSLLNLYAGRINSAEPLIIKNSSNDINSLRRLGVTTLTKLYNVNEVTDIPRFDLLDGMYEDSFERAINVIKISDENRIVVAGRSNKIYYSNINPNSIDDLKFNSLSIHHEVKSLELLNSDVFFVGLSNGELWYVSIDQNEKVMVYPDKRKFKNFPISKLKLIGNEVYFINKNMMFSYDPNTKILNEFYLDQLGGDILIDLTSDNNGKIYLATDNGKIIEFILNDNSHSVIFDNNKNEILFSNDRVTKVNFVDDKFIFTTKNGWVYIYDKIPGSGLTFNRRILAHGSEITKIFYEKLDKELMSSALDGSFCIFNLDNSNTLQEERIDLNFAVKSKINDINSLVLNLKNYILVGDNKGSLSILNFELDDIYAIINEEIENQLN